MPRRTGKTTRQISGSTKNSFFICCGYDTIYEKKIAERLGRHDIKILPRCAATEFYRFRGRRPLNVVFDHAFWGYCTDDESHGARDIELYMTRN